MNAVGVYITEFGVTVCGFKKFVRSSGNDGRARQRLALMFFFYLIRDLGSLILYGFERNRFERMGLWNRQQRGCWLKDGKTFESFV